MKRLLENENGGTASEANEVPDETGSDELTVKDIIQMGRDTGILEGKQGGWVWFGNRNLGQSMESVESYFIKFPQIKAQIVDKIGARSRKLESSGIKPGEEVHVLTTSQLEEMLNKKTAEVEDNLKDMVAKMVNKIQGKEDKAYSLKELTEAIKGMNPEYAAAAGKIYHEADIDPDDHLDTPVFYFTFMYYLSIWDKRKHGKNVSTPYNAPIQFNFYGANLKKTGTRYDEAIPIAMAKVESKRIMEWLEDDSRFGTIYFKKATDAINVDRSKMMFHERARQMVSGFGQGDILTRVKQKGLGVSDDIDKMRDSLIDALAIEMQDRALLQQRNGSRFEINGAIVN